MMRTMFHEKRLTAFALITALCAKYPPNKATLKERSAEDLMRGVLNYAYAFSFCPDFLHKINVKKIALGNKDTLQIRKWESRFY